jgi:hypothetical protein
VAFYERSHTLKDAHREALRVLAVGGSYEDASRAAGLSDTTIARLDRSRAGRAYMQRVRDQIDAHRVLLAATLPHLDFLSGNVHRREKPKKTRAKVKSSTKSRRGAASADQTDGRMGGSGSMGGNPGPHDAETDTETA